MHSFDDRLWNALDHMRIAAAGAALSFEARLAREQGWSAAFTATVMREYRRFLYLAATAPDPVTPSEAVDAAWHLHLSYTRHYWEELCPNILARPLHHQPTEGGPDEQARYRHQYAVTLARYAETFGAPPPAAVWPDAHARFGSPKRRAPTGALAIAGLSSVSLAACTALAGNAGGSGRATAAVVVAVVVGVFVFAVLASLIFGAKLKREKADGSCSTFVGDGGSGESGCGGGCGGGD